MPQVGATVGPIYCRVPKEKSMSSDDSQKIWPPPSNEYQTQVDEVSQKSDIWRFCLACAEQKLTIEAKYKFHSFQWTLEWQDWLRALGVGVAGAVVGAIMLLSGMLLLLFYGHPANWVIDFKLALFLAAVVGLMGGFVCGTGCWFVGRSLVRWRSSRHSSHQPQEL